VKPNETQTPRNEGLNIMAQHFDIQRHFRGLRKQGATILETAHGYLIQAPNGSVVAVHHSHRGTHPYSYKRTVSMLKKAGLRI